MNVKMKKIACFAGVALAYFSIFFFGRISFPPPGERILVRLQISSAHRSKLLSETGLTETQNKSIQSELELLFKTSD